VPRPYCISPVEIESKYIDLPNIKKGGFFMERIRGVSLDFKEGDIQPLMEEASKVVNSIEKNVGFRISSFYKLYPRNVMYNEKNNGIVLIDFGHWEF